MNPQHKQQAMQQVKVLQQQLLQKFPVYFQRLKQFQLYQKQKQLQQQRAGVAAGTIGDGGGANMNNQFNNNLLQPQHQTQQQHFTNLLTQGVAPPMANPQPVNAVSSAQSSALEPKKKRVYKKKAAK